MPNATVIQMPKHPTETVSRSERRHTPALIPQTLYSVTFTADDDTRKTRHIAAKDETHAVRLFRRYFAGDIEKVERLQSCYVSPTA